jgi:hypothetical protein
MLDGKAYRRAYRTQNGIHEDRYIVGDATHSAVEMDYEYDWITEYEKELLSFQFDIWVNTGVFEIGGEYQESSCGGYSSIFYSYFKYYEWTPKKGPDNSDFTLVDYDSYEDDSLDEKRWGGYVNGPPYGTICRDGKAVSTINCYKETGYLLDIPYDSGDLSNKELAAEMESQIASCNRGIPLKIID